jgi:hypothetical protein
MCSIIFIITIILLISINNEISAEEAKETTIIYPNPADKQWELPVFPPLDRKPPILEPSNPNVTISLPYDKLVCILYYYLSIHLSK